jgi:hypothetical protein
MAHIAASIMTNCAAIRHISGSQVAYSGTQCAAIRYLFRQFMCVPTVTYKQALWGWRPGRGGVTSLFGNSAALAVKTRTKKSEGNDFPRHPLDFSGRGVPGGANWSGVIESRSKIAAALTL